MDVDTQADKTDTEDEVDAPVFRYECEFGFFELPPVFEKFHRSKKPCCAAYIPLRLMMILSFWGSIVRSESSEPS